MNIQSLPSDVIIFLMQFLSTRDLASLSAVCKFLHSLIEEFGWKTYVRLDSRPSYSLRKSFSSWDFRSQARYNTLTDRNWVYAESVARPLSLKWTGKFRSLLAINSSRLFVGAGNTIYTYAFTQTKPTDSPGIRLESMYTTSTQLQARHDLSSLVCVSDEGLDRTLYVGYADGALERVTLPACRAGLESTTVEPSVRKKQYFHGNEMVESLSSTGEHVLSLSNDGTAVFFNRSYHAHSEEAQIINLEGRGWATYLSTKSSTPYAVFGTSSLSPLVVHNICTSQVSLNPSAVLASTQSLEQPERSSAVYGISGAPSSSPWGSSDQIIVSGWYDGVVRVHDLRSCARACSSGNASTEPEPLRPVMSVYDPWTFEPIYTVSCGGGSSSHIAAGTARHSVVSFWDVRYPTRGWSVHGPGNDSSPVYSVILESSRLFGATQSRPFVLDFGPDLKEETYPRLHRDYREEGLKRRDKSGAGFYVTKYSHARTR
ncbi:hypothetical protein SCP_0703640 [Sparassis crispa]|uniref:F-box domain-containing protein n=1 Tax=Sparassis crispa TaxID=139825 RepID=A0A401GSH2_9APHY|nr:hypothetical protein SCP_0703640 [Sparassis crispa]GBE85178.1 hypothetical protein SCP_0703640 [Sparassis crispa]